MDKISVILTCFNEGILLKKAVESLEVQSDKNFEIIIVNDCSSEKITNSICLELEKQSNVKIIWHRKNMGLSHARNSGYQECKGDIVVPLDADDTLPPDVIEKLRSIFKRIPEADFVFGNYIRRDLKNRTEEIVDCSNLCAVDGFIDSKKLLRDWKLLGTSPCRKSAWEKVGGYDNEFSFDGQDMDFFMRLLGNGSKGYYVNHILYVWNKSEKGMNTQVLPEVWSRVHLKNISFLDQIRMGREVREKAMWDSIKENDINNAKVRAMELIKLKDTSLSAVIIASFPIPVIRWIYRSIINNAKIN